MYSLENQKEIHMKINTKLVLTLAVFTALSNLAYADGSAFTPLNFDDYSTPKAPKTAPAAAKSTSNPISNAMSKVMPAKNVPTIDAASGEVPIGNENIQNAILELDNAQVGIRNDLLNYKAKYADVDAQFKLIKNERSMLYKQVRLIERRIKKIDKTKEGLRRNML